MVLEFFVVGGVVAATIGGWMKLVRPFYHGVREGLRNVQAGLALLDAQLTPNGGSSLVDQVRAHGTAIARIELGQERIEQRLGVLESPAPPAADSRTDMR